MRSLLVISSAPATMVDGLPFLDKKFVEGMRLYASLWDGPVTCLLKTSEEAVPFGKVFDPGSLPFRIDFLAPNRPVGTAQLAGHDVVLCSGDNHEYLHLAELCRKAQVKLAYIIEYIPETRRQNIFLNRGASLPKKLHSLAWTVLQERRRRKAFGLADGIQANGYPAHAAYRPINPNTMMYLDNRAGAALMATDAELEARAQRLSGGAPIRLLHSGRLEPMKGSHDLIPVARRLAAAGVEFELDIFGTGSLEGEIRKGIAENGLEEKVRLHGVVDFETELVPFARSRSDIYLSCHRQSDPSCTYLENMACGLAVVGYENRMWAALCADSAAGWTAPLGRVEALAAAIGAAAADRGRLAGICRIARDFARANSFEHEFGRRIAHLKALGSDA